MANKAEEFEDVPLPLNKDMFKAMLRCYDIHDLRFMRAVCDRELLRRETNEAIAATPMRDQVECIIVTKTLDKSKET